MENFDPNKTPKKQILSAQIDLSKFERATDEEKRQQDVMSESTSFFKDGMRKLFKNPLAVLSIVVLAAIILTIIIAPMIVPYGYEEILSVNGKRDKGAKNLAPFTYSKAEQKYIDEGGTRFPHIMGTDEQCRDYFIRVIYGTRISLVVGFFASIIVLIIGKRKGFGTQPIRPHNVPFVMLGAFLLWFGWFGFNAGSAFAANGTAGYAWVSTSAATAAAMLSWGFTEKIRTGHYTAMGAASGIVAGLVAITPAADVVSPLWAIVMGAIAGVLTCLACGLKFKFGYDDSLDVVGVHGVGGFTGTILVGFFGEGTGLFAGGDWRQLVVQIIVALVAIVWSAVITGIIAFALEKTIGWRVTEAQEVGGIDLADQGERAYDFAGTASSVLKEVK